MPPTFISSLANIASRAGNPGRASRGAVAAVAVVDGPSAVAGAVGPANAGEFADGSAVQPRTMRGWRARAATAWLGRARTRGAGRRETRAHAPAATAEPYGVRLDVLLEVLRERGQPYTPDQTATIVQRLAQALESSHRQGIVHGAIRLSNVRMLDMLEPVLAGFGSGGMPLVPMTSTVPIAPAMPATTTTGAIGLLQNLSPEQVMGGPGDRRSDVFALGMLTYEMLLGRAPLAAAETPAHYLHTCATLTPPAVLAPTVPAALSAIVMRAVRPLPDQRYARAIDLSIDLQRYLRHRQLEPRPLHAEAAPSTSPAPTPTATPAATPLHAPMPARLAAPFGARLQRLLDRAVRPMQPLVSMILGAARRVRLLRHAPDRRHLFGRRR